MVRRFQLFRLGVAFLNVDHFAFYRKLNGGCKPELFNRMYRIPEKRLNGSPSMVVTSARRQLSENLTSWHMRPKPYQVCNSKHMFLFTKKDYKNVTLLWTKWSTPCEIIWKLPCCWRHDHWRRLIQAFWEGGWIWHVQGLISPAIGTRLTSGKKHSLLNQKN